jgi:hypothetical protein
MEWDRRQDVGIIYGTFEILALTIGGIYGIVISKMVLANGCSYDSGDALAHT